VWVHVRAQGLCSEVIDGRISIHGESCIRTMKSISVIRRAAVSGDAAIREWPGAG
jgi:hypothetical protein